jgi:glycosyltransferase involved in cell wall biosynthesis
MTGDPIRALQVFDPPGGGVPEHVHQLTVGLMERGFDITVAGPPDAASRSSLEARGVRYVALPDFVGDMLALRKDAPTFRAIVEVLRAERFDLVHTHQQKAGLLGRLAAPLARTSAIYTPHSLTHRFMFVRPYPRARSRYLKTLWMERALGPLTAAFIAVSEEERDGAVDDRIIRADRVRVIRNGVEFDDSIPADPRLLEFRGEGPLLGFLAALRNQKGLPTLLDALEILARRGEPPRFAIVGSGPEERDVRGRVLESPLRSRTLLLPFEGPVEPYLRAFDAFVLPSYWEGLPLAVLEAMAAGLPVVASAIGGTPEAVADGETGLLVPVGDASALAERMSQIAADADLRARMGAAGRTRWEEEFRVERMVEETAALYERVVAARRRHQRP